MLAYFLEKLTLSHLTPRKLAINVCIYFVRSRTETLPGRGGGGGGGALFQIHFSDVTDKLAHPSFHAISYG